MKKKYFVNYLYPIKKNKHYCRYQGVIANEEITETKLTPDIEICLQLTSTFLSPINSSRGVQMCQNQRHNIDVTHFVGASVQHRLKFPHVKTQRLWVFVSGYQQYFSQTLGCNPPAKIN